MSALRKLKAYALGHNTDTTQTAAQLQAASVPVSEAPCRGCADPCEEAHDEYPKFDVDMETEMLGSVKPYARQIVISTGKTDWVREVTDAKGTLAAYISQASGSSDGAKVKSKGKDGKSPERRKPANGTSVSGVFASDLSNVTKVTILNGSHRTISEDHKKETVLVFPDYKVVTQVDQTYKGAEALWKHAVSPSVPLHSVPTNTCDSDGPTMKSWILPYSCVILLCSHKRRDNRCAIAAPKLEHALTLALEREGWEVHTQVEDPSTFGLALEDDPSLHLKQNDDGGGGAGAGESHERHTKTEATNGHKGESATHSGTDTNAPEEKRDLDSNAQREVEGQILRRLQRVDSAHAEHKRALILYTSHIGGHKYAGNVIIHTPRGVSVWYGRVTPHEVDAIVTETIIGGRIFPALLRGGMNLCYPGYKSLHDW